MRIATLRERERTEVSATPRLVLLLLKKICFVAGVSLFASGVVTRVLESCRVRASSSRVGRPSRSTQSWGVLRRVRWSCP